MINSTRYVRLCMLLLGLSSIHSFYTKTHASEQNSISYIDNQSILQQKIIRNSNQEIHRLEELNNNESYRNDNTDAQTPIDFDGVNDYIDFGSSHDLNASFSFEAWILQQATTISGAIISKRDTKEGEGNQRGYHLSVNNNFLNLTWYNEIGTKIIDITSPYEITNNKWYHVAATFDGTNAILFIDGLKVISTMPSNPPATTNADFLIGAMYNSNTPNTPRNHFNGFIDEVRIWNVGLTTKQLREMMNQEIEQNNTTVRGKVIPKDISDDLLWSSLNGYYPMRSNTAIDFSSNNFNGVPKNATTMQLQTAPLPYSTVRTGRWKNNDEQTPWLYGDSVWNLPNSIGIDGITTIDWNIVKISHDMVIDTYESLGRERHVLALLVNGTLTIKGNTDSVSGNGLTVDSYLQLNGKIDLEGESQLIQTENSALEVGVNGYLERDQQGTKDLFTYNYWSSPVGYSATEYPNNYSYNLNNNILKNGTDSTSPSTINFIGGYDGNTSNSEISIAHYWIWKYINRVNDNYASWQHVRNTGIINAGEGFTMKGATNTEGNVSLLQNYVFSGKPNNGIVAININPGYDYLVGNPYASAIDAEAFITENGPQIAGSGENPKISGTIYFWEHWGGGSHIASEYKGGYGTYNYSGGVPASAWGILNPDVAQFGTSTKKPGRFIPVGQSFFVEAESTGIITFKNKMRVFQKEGRSSTFVRSTQEPSNRTTFSDERMKLRIGFNSINTYHRQLLVTADERATSEYDWGFEALLKEEQKDDMYWMISDNKYTIQGVETISESTILPIGIHTDSDGLNNITIDVLENMPNDLEIYLHDIDLNLYHNLKNNEYEVFLIAGEYLNRFEITFTNPSLGIIENEFDRTLQVYYANSNESIIIHNPELIDLKSIELYNILGQSILKETSLETTNYSTYKAKNLSSGPYIINMKTKFGKTVKKKVLVK